MTWQNLDRDIADAFSDNFRVEREDLTSGYSTHSFLNTVRRTRSEEPSVEQRETARVARLKRSREAEKVVRGKRSPAQRQRDLDYKRAWRAANAVAIRERNRQLWAAASPEQREASRTRVREHRARKRCQ